MELTRRQYLGGITSVALPLLAGCSGASPSSEGNDDKPITKEPQALFPNASVFGDSWEQDDVQETDGSVKSGYVNWDSKEEILVRVWKYDTVKAAKSEYDSRYNKHSEDAGNDAVSFGESEIASESFSVKVDVPRVHFRDANVIGKCAYTNFGGNSVSGSVSTAEKHAVTWHKTWRQ